MGRQTTSELNILLCSFGQKQKKQGHNVHVETLPRLMWQKKKKKIIVIIQVQQHR